MHSILKFQSFLVFDETTKKYFYRTFKNVFNVIYGKNTSGKSTLIQSLLYTFGINDVKNRLTEILANNPIFRLECLVNEKELIIVRHIDNIYIKYNSQKIDRFYGIGHDVSQEHVRLKEFLSNLFNFTLMLESKNNFKEAPIETMFLPYYISQSNGWDEVRESFNNLGYYKKFKHDYLDYYLGIETSEDRLEKQKLEIEKYNLQKELDFYSNFEQNHKELQISKMADEEFIKQAMEYIDEYNKDQKDLKRFEKDLIFISNELGYHKTRLSILKKIKKNQDTQNPEHDKCPVCSNKLNPSTENIYAYHQEINDTSSQLETTNKIIQGLQADIDSLTRKISTIQIKIEERYKVIQENNLQDISFKTWITNKSNLEILRNLDAKKTKIEERFKLVDSDLKKYKTDADVQNLRNLQDLEFSKVFKELLKQLKIENSFMLSDSNKYTSLYDASDFPLQGVERHKTILAHVFAFNKIIAKSKKIHRFPLMLDAIFKEDIEESNKNIILEFLEKNMPPDTQTFISVAESKGNEWVSSRLGYGNLINIGESTEERAFLVANDLKKIENILSSTNEIIDAI